MVKKKKPKTKNAETQDASAQAKHIQTLRTRYNQIAYKRNWTLTYSWVIKIIFYFKKKKPILDIIRLTHKWRTHQIR